LSADEQFPHPQPAWPPIKGDLQRLYVDDKLSAAKIAKIYGRGTGNRRSGAELIRHYLKKHGIERRNRVAELAKDTEDMVATWKEKHPAQKNPDMEEEKSAVLELIRNEGLSIEHLDQETKGRVQAEMQHLYRAQGASMTDIADLIGNKTSGYVSWLFGHLGIQAKPFEQARLQGIIDKVRVHERKPFDGTYEDKAYLLGLKQGDLYAHRPWKGAVRVSLSTTHPYMCELFEELFSPYGYVRRLPRYKEPTKSYEWNLEVYLDDSFAFLLQEFEESLPWVRATETRVFAYLSGLLDADGSIIITKDNSEPKKVLVTVDYYNSKKPILEWISRELKSRGFHCSVRINKPKDYTTKKWGITHRSDYWQLSSYGMDRIQNLVARLKPHHGEKIMRQQLALSVKKGQEFALVEERLRELDRLFYTGVIESLRAAEQLYNQTHGGEVGDGWH
jgi:LAGLIDADG-like domain